MCLLQNRSQAPSQCGKRPLLLNIENINTSAITKYKREDAPKANENVAPREKRIRLAAKSKSFIIPEKKAIKLSDKDLSATQEIISDHVSTKRQN